jgi:UDP-N-acetyl-2-amino-2-deoxyglucuronate dehydrogenase
MPDETRIINFALLGCGRIAKRHSELLGLGQIKNARLVAVCDSDKPKADAIASRFGVNAYSDYRSMMAKESIDAVVVLTESGLHASHVIDLASFGKHIVVEKPMALTIDDADRMIEATKSHGARLFVVKQNRFNVPVIKLREALDKGRFGKLILGTVRVRWARDASYYDQAAWRGTWALDGGVLANQASHHVDLLEWMMGEVESVYAMSTTALAKIQAEDTLVAALRFKSGALGAVEATTAARPTDLEGSISILGERGTVEIGGFAVNEMRTWKFVDPEPQDEEVIKTHSVNPPNVYGFGHQAYYDHVVDSILSDEAALIEGAEGRKSIRLINAIYKSIETGREVRLEDSDLVTKLGAR